MPVWQAIQSLIDVLQGIPSNIVPHDHVSSRRPSATADLPSLVVSAADVTELPAGLGSLVGTSRLSDTAWSSTTATRSSGQFLLELWAQDSAGVEALADAVFDRLEAHADDVASAGFLVLSVSSAGPIEQAALGVAGPETALKLPVGCSFAFEAVTPEETGPDGIIRHVNVDMSEPPGVPPKDQFEETMDIHASP
jgi:hypothetical protein